MQNLTPPQRKEKDYFPVSCEMMKDIKTYGFYFLMIISKKNGISSFFCIFLKIIKI